MMRAAGTEPSFAEKLLQAEVASRRCRFGCDTPARCPSSALFFAFGNEGGIPILLLACAEHRQRWEACAGHVWRPIAGLDAAVAEQRGVLSWW